MLNKKNTIKTAGIMVMATLLAKLAGMGREVLFASLYGTSGQAAAFLTASRIPLLFFDITLGAAISASFIPIYNEYLEADAKEAANRYANSFINLVLIITGVFCALGITFARPIAGLIGKGLAQPEKELAAQLVIILFPTMICTALAYALTGILQSHGEFNIPAAISLVSNGIMMLYLLFVRDRLGIHGVAFAMLIAWGFQVLVQLPSLQKKCFRYRPVLDLRSDGIKKTIKLALPILISSWVQPINSTVNIYLASFLNEGQAVAALDYANKLYIIFVGVLTYAVSNLIFPSISRLAAGENREELAAVVAKAIKVVLAVILPVMMLFLLLRVPIVRFVYERGEFDAQSTALTASALLFYSLGMAGFGVSEIANKAFYALKDGKTPMYIAMGGILLNILLSFLFVRGLSVGLWGLALAASIAATLIALALVFVLNKRLHLFKPRDAFNMIKLFVSTACMGMLTYFVFGLCSFSDSLAGRFLALLIPAAAGMLLYVLLLFVLHTEEAKDILAILQQKTKKVN
ncbi:MAG: murein biosynthesis integral membrane protein MurJ [Ruminococcaceae bacterium]|nr:murein biosynthesis integral membrane protein MurJ [Oscillospiraceae bacterium]